MPLGALLHFEDHKRIIKSYMDSRCPFAVYASLMYYFSSQLSHYRDILIVWWVKGRIILTNFRRVIHLKQRKQKAKITQRSYGLKKLIFLTLLGGQTAKKVLYFCNHEENNTGLICNSHLVPGKGRRRH